MNRGRHGLTRLSELGHFTQATDSGYRHSTVFAAVSADSGYGNSTRSTGLGYGHSTRSTDVEYRSPLVAASVHSPSSLARQQKMTTHPHDEGIS